jgi:hypothetical protein
MEIEKEILSLNPDKLDIDHTTKILIKKLLGITEQLIKENRELREEVQRLRDEVARLKGEKGKPRVLPNLEGHKENDNAVDENRTKHEWKKEAKTPHIHIDREETVPIDRRKLPSDVIFKGYRFVIVQDVKIETNNVRFKIPRYYSPSKGKTYEGELPGWVNGGFGPELKAYILDLYFAGRVPEDKIRSMLEEIGIVISEGQISNIITDTVEGSFTKEKEDIFDAGMSSSEFIHTDDTAVRHNGINHHVTTVCTALFSAFFINRYKNRETVKEIFGLDAGELLKKILISDDARQFWYVALLQLLCWVHEIRHYKNLRPILDYHVVIHKKFLGEVYAFHRLLKRYKKHPTIRMKNKILERFDQLFMTETGYAELDEIIRRTYSKKDKLLLVLDHPNIPLDNNEAERALREFVVKRVVSHGTRSRRGQRAWENMMTILGTSKKLGISFNRYVKDILSKEYEMPRLAEMILTKAQLTSTSY